EAANELGDVGRDFADLRLAREVGVDPRIGLVFVAMLGVPSENQTLIAVPVIRNPKLLEQAALRCASEGASCGELVARTIDSVHVVDDHGLREVAQRLARIVTIAVCRTAWERGRKSTEFLAGEANRIEISGPCLDIDLLPAEVARVARRQSAVAR